MCKTFAINEDVAGLWCLRSGEARVAGRLSLIAAIRDGGRRAREHHLRTGENTLLELDACGGRSVIDVYGEHLIPAARDAHGVSGASSASRFVPASR